MIPVVTGTNDHRDDTPTNESSSKEESGGWGFKAHQPPVLVTFDDVPVMTIPDEEGYFPTRSRVTDPLVTCPQTKIYQMHPKYGRGRKIATGTLVLGDPAAGTPSEVALVGECGEDNLSFYVKGSDAVTRVSPTEYLLLLPNDCLGLRLDEKSIDPATLSTLEAILAARTRFCDDSESVKSLKQIEYTSDNKEIVPNDRVSQSMYKMSLWTAAMVVRTSERGAKHIESYGQKKREGVKETTERNVSSASIKRAEQLRRASETTSAVATKISDTIANTVGGTVGRHIAPKADDTATKRRGRSILLASSVAYAEVADGVGEGYEKMVRSAQAEATAYVAVKYGRDAAELARHTAGATVNFGSAALTMRRVINVKKVVKSSAKKMMKESIKKSVMG